MSLPHPIRNDHVEADSAHYNDCWYVRSRWYVYTYTIDLLEFVISFSSSPYVLYVVLFVFVCVRFLSFFPVTFFSKSRFGLSLLFSPYVVITLLTFPKFCDFYFFWIFIRLNDIGSKLSNIRQRGEKAVRMRPSFFFFLSITNYTTYVVHGTIIECRVHRGLYFHSILSLRIGRKMR